MKAGEFDKKFDEGAEDIVDDVDVSTASRPLKMEVEQPWLEEAARRDAELSTGLTDAPAAADVLSRARARRIEPRC